MDRSFYSRLAACCLVGLLAVAPTFSQQRSVTDWPVHDLTRPQPPIVGPATFSTEETPGRPPADAIVLFGGSDLSAWQAGNGGAAPWKVENGYMEVVGGSGSIRTKEGFGDVQLHVEWMAPTPIQGHSQERGNSGVLIMGQYEVQVLDSYGNQTYPDGQASAVYGQHPPLVNATKPPGTWNVYDIVFHRPRFGSNGQLTQPAFVTVFHNGVLVQDHVELTGPSGHKQRPPYTAHADRLPIGLQDHGNPTRFRNIWVRDLEAND